jgi:hypothetical protein
LTRVTGRHDVVHIIESLRARDRKTGERLRDRLGPVISGRGRALPVHFWRVSTKAELFDRLRGIADDARSTGLAPIVDLQTHGDFDGLQVTSDECLEWSDLKGPLTEINVACRLNLLVLMGACTGEALVRVLQPSDRAPVWAVIGPKRTLDEQQVEDAHAAFYAELMSNGNGDAAVRAMNAAAGAADSLFRFIDAVWFFREVMQAYFTQHATDPQLSRRIERMTAEALQEAARIGATSEQLTHLGATIPSKLDSQLRDYQSWFDHCKGIYFLGNECPNEWSRFTVSLADCLPGPGP